MKKSLITISAAIYAPTMLACNDSETLIKPKSSVQLTTSK
jgi:hypothetical protein